MHICVYMYVYMCRGGSNALIRNLCLLSWTVPQLDFDLSIKKPIVNDLTWDGALRVMWVGQRRIRRDWEREGKGVQ